LVVVEGLDLFDATTKAGKTPPKEPVLGGSPRCRPDYFVLGTRKGGTTSLVHYLALHPGIFPYKLRGRPDDGENFHALGTTAHSREYANARHLLVGDANVARLVNDAEALKTFCQSHQPRLFVLLRDPVARCHSQMLMRARLGSLGMSLDTTNATREVEAHLDAFRTFLERRRGDRRIRERAAPTPDMRSPRNCFYEALYDLHLDRLERAGFTRIKVYWSEQFFDPRYVLAVVQDAIAFLGLDPDDVKDLTAHLRRRHNARPRGGGSNLTNLALSPALVAAARETMRPYNDALAKTLQADIPPNWTLPYLYVP